MTNGVGNRQFNTYPADVLRIRQTAGGRPHAVAVVEFDDQGLAHLQVHPSRSSGVLSSVTWANALAVIAEGRVIQRGDDVGFIPFNELLT